MGVAVVLCTRDRPALLEAALPAVRAALRDGDEAVVVDSASVDPAVRRVGEAAGFRVVRAPRPGLTLARNLGIAATTAPIVAITDDDCRPRPDWTARLSAPFSDPLVGFATGRVLPDREDGPIVAVKTDEDRRRYEGPQDPGPIGHGANLSLRRIAIDGIGGFDEMLGPGTPLYAAEDQDVVYRVLRAGWAGVYDPDIVVVHAQWRGGGEVVRLRYRYGVGAGAVAMKVARLDRRLGREVLWDRLWAGGLAVSARAIRARYRTGVVSGLARAAGTSVGALRAARLPLVDGRYTAPHHLRQKA
jgi:glycosyltransferase involved in cell wall biosynthesis